MVSERVSFVMSSVDQFFDLAPAERAAYYRGLADDMRSRADRSVLGETRAAYLSMAIEWLDMAEKLEAEYGKFSVVVDAPELAALLRRRPSSDGTR